MINTPGATYGSSYLPSDLNAAYLWAQLENSTEIQNWRMNCWNKYYEAFSGFLKTMGSGENEYFTLPYIPEGCIHNAHMFYLITRNFDERCALISHLKENQISAVFHYIPLHSAPAGIKYGRFDGKDEITTEYSERLVRLPMYYGLSSDDQDKVISSVIDFYKTR